MQEKLDYHHDDNHVERRSAISDALRQTIIDRPRSEWANDPRFRGEPAHWLEIHRGLLGASEALRVWSEAFCGEVPDSDRQELARQIHGLGGRLVHHAHGHHNIEDYHFFPFFTQRFPQLKQPIELLDGDHRVLSEVLDELEASVAAFQVRPEGSDKAMMDQWLAGGERLHAAADRLDRLFIRHINDEEEICIPAMLSL